MPVTSPLVDPLIWVEQLIGRRFPGVLAARVLTWDEPLPRELDPLPLESPTYLPHIHFAAAELLELAAAAGLEPIKVGSFEFPAPQSPLGERLRTLTASHPRLGAALADGLEAAASAIPGVSGLGTHHLLVFRPAGIPQGGRAARATASTVVAGDIGCSGRALFAAYDPWGRPTSWSRALGARAPEARQLKRSSGVRRAASPMYRILSRSAPSLAAILGTASISQTSASSPERRPRPRTPKAVLTGKTSPVRRPGSAFGQDLVAPPRALVDRPQPGEPVLLEQLID